MFRKSKTVCRLLRGLRSSPGSADGWAYSGPVIWEMLPGLPFMKTDRKSTPWYWHATLSDATLETYVFGGFTLEGCLLWTLQLTRPQASATVPALLRQWLPLPFDEPARIAFDTLPLRDGDLAALGHHVPWWQDWVDHAEPVILSGNLSTSGVASRPRLRQR